MEFLVDLSMWSLVDQQDERKTARHWIEHSTHILCISPDPQGLSMSYTLSGFWYLICVGQFSLLTHECIFFTQKKTCCSLSKVHAIKVHKGHTAANQLVNSGSRKIPEIKECWAWLVFGWETHVQGLNWKFLSMQVWSCWHFQGKVKVGHVRSTCASRGINRCADAQNVVPVIVNIGEPILPLGGHLKQRNH